MDRGTFLAIVGGQVHAAAGASAEPPVATGQAFERIGDGPCAARPS